MSAMWAADNAVRKKHVSLESESEKYERAPDYKSNSANMVIVLVYGNL